VVDGGVLHIGRIGVRADGCDVPPVVDWRAAAARPAR
jgi:hypothetical protein